MKERKPTRTALQTASDVLEWLASGDQDPEMAQDIRATKSLVDLLLENGW